MSKRLDRWVRAISDTGWALLLWVVLPLLVVFVGFTIQTGVSEAARVTGTLSLVMAACGLLYLAGFWLFAAVGQLFIWLDERRHRP